ncbi:GMC family oxidoreductase [Rhizobium giardinii]|uniref:Choline dehydrogenase n=1 Tax=Rhizobium giardinii TaxID=56731 RepID=A0A7W8UCW7_9HYPH|nr:GMC family oxidoreductase N-terminal domain-containing protein [Rhizobium giardinii]MBB5536187.1 choline dehydrogenase [Rhizobium giardinii]
MANAREEIETFDFVVIGGGTSGCVITNRLSQAGFKVCLLEAGPKDINPMIHIPAGYIKNISSKKLTWNFMSEPNPGTNNRSFSLPQGRVLGGSSSINGLNYVRGQAIDYDNWSAEGNPGWSYNEILPYFKRSERRIGDADDRYRGREGELPITDLDWHHPVSDALIDAAVELGIPRNPDYNGAEQDGVGFFQRTIYKGFRHSSARAFLSKAIKRNNVDVRTNCHATSVLFEGNKAVGITYVLGGPGGSRREVRASREIILTAGALNTPKLLQLSGIGPANVLSRAGIEIFHDLAGVGNNLRDHYAVRMVAKVKGSKTINDVAQGPALLGQIARWALGRPSILAVSPSLVHIFWKSDPALPRPDLEFACAPASFREGVVGLLDKHPGLTLGIWQERPESLGSCHVKSSDVFESPAIQPNYLTHKTDQNALIGGMRLARRLFRSQALDRYIEAETSPTPNFESDDELLDFARQKGTTVYHMIGTARMGPRSSPGTVVDAELRVHGVAGLRVCDASIMPSMPSANTNASTLMIAEKAADLILGRKLAAIVTRAEHAA